MNWCITWCCQLVPLQQEVGQHHVLFLGHRSQGGLICVPQLRDDLEEGGEQQGGGCAGGWGAKLQVGWRVGRGSG